MNFYQQRRSLLCRALVLTVAAFIVTVPFFRGFLPTTSVEAQGVKQKAIPLPEVSAESEGYVLTERNGQRVCQEAAPAEALRWRRSGQDQEMRVIYPAHTSLKAEEQQQTGLRIVLRSTAQLDNFPDAKAAFIRAAQNWEAQILTPISIIIDVDFGTTFFGESYPNNNIIGQTSSQLLGSATGYAPYRQRMIDTASSNAEASLYNALPAGQLPTDQGNVTRVSGSSAVFRALGIIGAIANPDTEQLGPPPRIGFNSAFSFDFDPSDGINAFQIDFDGTATHEIGHALGFSSFVGEKELTPSVSTRVSFLDFFRFRPGVTLGSFATAQRILASGGTQSFYGGGAELGLSTGRPDGMGGDNNQGSHWKADELTGVYIGVMDPTAGRGRREQITPNDLHAFDTIGYRVRSAQQQIDAARLVDFGDAALNTNLDRTLVVSNTGGQALQVTSLSINNAQFRVVSPSGAFTIQPNSQQNVVLRFTPTASGAQTATLTLNSNDPNQPSLGVTLNGFGGTLPTVALNSGTAQNGSIGAPLPTAECLMDATQYTIQVPANATQLRVTLSGNTDVDLYARFGARVGGAEPNWIADHVSNSPNNTESIDITPSTNPTLRGGTYYLAVTNCGPGASNYTLTATVTGGSTGTLAAVSAASFRGTELTSESIASLFGQNLATTTAGVTTASLPTTLGGTTVRVRDSAGTERLAPLFFVSPAQINYLMPAGTTNGPATMTVTSGSGAISTGTINVVSVAPGLFAANANGQGVAAAVSLRVRGTAQSFEAMTRFDTTTSRFVTVPIDLGLATDQVFLVLFGTGLRNRTSINAVSAQIGGLASQVTFAGAQGGQGLDQINVLLPRTLAGRGEVNVTLTVDGKTTNTVVANIR